jgi:hypothetical protein
MHRGERRAISSRAPAQLLESGRRLAGRVHGTNRRGIETAEMDSTHLGRAPKIAVWRRCHTKDQAAKSYQRHVSWGQILERHAGIECVQNPGYPVHVSSEDHGPRRLPLEY